MSLIELRAVEKVFAMGAATVRALDGVDLTIEAGEIVAVMGTSGSGKSTLMNVLGCLDTPTAGHYRLNGEAVEARDEPTLAALRNETIGFVFQTFNLLPRMTALANVEMPLMYAGVPREARRARARAALEQVGLAHRLEHRSHELSGGQRQRVAVARALVNDPAIVLADEPTGNLDTRTSAEVMELFRTLHLAGKTVIVVTHEPEIGAYAERRIVLCDGRVLSDTVH